MMGVCVLKNCAKLTDCLHYYQRWADEMGHFLLWLPGTMRTKKSLRSPKGTRLVSNFAEVYKISINQVEVLFCLLAIRLLKMPTQEDRTQLTLFVGPYAQYRLENSRLFHPFQDEYPPAPASATADEPDDQLERPLPDRPQALVDSLRWSPLTHLPVGSAQWFTAHYPRLTILQAVVSTHWMGHQRGEETLNELCAMLNEWAPTLRRLRLWLTGVFPREPSNSGEDDDNNGVDSDAFSELWSKLCILVLAGELKVLHLDVNRYERDGRGCIRR